MIIVLILKSCHKKEAASYSETASFILVDYILC